MDNTADHLLPIRELLSSRLHGVLASQSLDMPGYPFGSVVPYSLSPAGWPLLLLSHLAKHTRNILATPTCSLTITEAGEGDVQQQMRLTCLGQIRPLNSLAPGLAERHFRYYPDSRDYFEQLNFRFFELIPERFYCIGGFGAARWIGVEHLNRPNPLSLEQERNLLQRLESNHTADIINRLELGTESLDDEPLCLCGIDSQGIDIRLQGRFFRLQFPTACDTPERIETALGALFNNS